jgi:hypothetical protein
VFVCACLALAFPLGARAETVTIVLTSWTTIEDQHLAPHAASHPAKGDFIDFRDLLVNRGRSQFGRPPDRAVAWDEGLVQYTGKTTSTMKVLVTFPGLGTMLYEGPQVQQANGDTVLPIVRGTGAFKGVKGTVTIGPGANTAPNTFRITVPGDGINLGSGAPVA